MFGSDIRSMINYIQSNSNQLKYLKKKFFPTLKEMHVSSQFFFGLKSAEKKPVKSLQWYDL